MIAMRIVLKKLLLLALPIFILSCSEAFPSTPKVYVLSVEGAINPASSSLIESGIEAALEGEAECLVIMLNTPGGLLESTRIIVRDILNSTVPVVVYVAPGGSQAASAGVFVTLAAHIAAMAPATNIGAAHPVSLQGQADSVMIEKAVNDASAFIRSIAEERKRNVEWAEQAVRKSLSVTETEALRESIIDLVAHDIDELLLMIDGREVQIGRVTHTLRTAGAEVINIEMTWQQKFLRVLTDPNIAYILMMIGITGIMFEIYNPGSILPGVVGVISLILAFYSLHTLPVNYAGLALIIFAVVLFLLEIKVPSYGILTLGGITSLVLGSIMLISSDSALEFARISWSVIIPVTAFITAFFLFAIGMGLKAQMRKPTTGTEGLIGTVGEALEPLNPTGEVRVSGELWTAESVEGKIKKGEKIEVVAIEDLKLKVKKVQ
jgi:membrane-bound serine protease (ClpP class)